MAHEGDDHTSHQTVIKETGGFGNKRKGVDHPNYNIIKNSQNTKGHGDLRRLSVTETSLKDQQLTLM